MALVRLISSRKLSPPFFSRNVDRLELTRIESIRAAFFSTQKLVGDEPVLVSFRFLVFKFGRPLISWISDKVMNFTILR